MPDRNSSTISQMRARWVPGFFGDSDDFSDSECRVLVNRAFEDIPALLDVAEAAQAWEATLRPVTDINTKEKASAWARRNFAARDALLDALGKIPQGEPE